MEPSIKIVVYRGAFLAFFGVIVALLSSCALPTKSKPCRESESKMDIVVSQQSFLRYLDEFCKALSWSQKDGLSLSIDNERLDDNFSKAVTYPLVWGFWEERRAREHFRLLVEQMNFLDRVYRPGARCDATTARSIADEFCSALAEASGAALFPIIEDGKRPELNGRPGELRPVWKQSCYRPEHMVALYGMRLEAASAIGSILPELVPDRNERIEVVEDLCRQILRKMALTLMYRFVEIIRSADQHRRYGEMYTEEVASVLGQYEKENFIEYEVLVWIPPRFLEKGLENIPLIEVNGAIVDARDTPGAPVTGGMPQEILEPLWRETYKRAMKLLLSIEASVQRGIIEGADLPLVERDIKNWAEVISDQIVESVGRVVEWDKWGRFPIVYEGFDLDAYSFVRCAHSLYREEFQGELETEPPKRRKEFADWMSSWAKRAHDSE